MHIQIPVINPSSYRRHIELTLHAVKLGFDILRYNDALGKNESGTNEAREEDLLKRFPPPADFTLRKPAILIDAGGRQILWYLPCAISRPLQVRRSIFLRLAMSHGGLGRYVCCNGANGRSFEEWYEYSINWITQWRQLENKSIQLLCSI